MSVAVSVKACVWPRPSQARNPLQKAAIGLATAAAVVLGTFAPLVSQM